MKQQSRLFLLFCFSFCFSFVATATARAQPFDLPVEGKRILERRFKSWKLAEVEDEIKLYYRRERSFESPNLIKGDWNGDRRTDYAALLEKKSDPQSRIVVVLIESARSYKIHLLEASDCLSSIRKGVKDYDYESGKTFRYENDAIFSSIWEKAGTSYVWQKGGFRAILTSD